MYQARTWRQDFLKIVKEALAAEGLKYKVAGISQNATIDPFPYLDRQRHVALRRAFFPSGWPCSIQLKDRDVILVNTRRRNCRTRRSR